MNNSAKTIGRLISDVIEKTEFGDEDVLSYYKYQILPFPENLGEGAMNDRLLIIVTKYCTTRPKDKDIIRSVYRSRKDLRIKDFLPGNIYHTFNDLFSEERCNRIAWKFEHILRLSLKLKRQLRPFAYLAIVKESKKVRFKIEQKNKGTETKSECKKSKYEKKVNNNKKKCIVIE